MRKILELAELGQAIWLDDFRREHLRTGWLTQLTDGGLRGLTSNLAVFEDAFSTSSDYDEQMRSLVEAEKTVQEIYEGLVIDDVRRAADVLRRVYDDSGGADGYVSLEVSPNTAHDTLGIIEEAARLFSAVNRPNLMITIPATPEGISAIEAVIGRGINVNVNLLFSTAQYQSAAAAYLAGLERLASAGRDLSRIGSVASFFVSRVDNAVDAALQRNIGGDRPAEDKTAASNLLGKLAIANAKLAYTCYQRTFQGVRWENLREQGAHIQQLLWTSTTTNNLAYPDTLYVDNLIGPDTVNTLPTAALKAVIDHARVERTLDRNLDQAKAQIAQAAELGIDLEAVSRQLLDEGVASLVRCFNSLIEAISQKRNRLATEMKYSRSVSGQMAAYRSGVNAALADAAHGHVVERVWTGDRTLWQPVPAGPAMQQGRPQLTGAMPAEIERLEALVREVRAEGYTHALLLGMGGSSLAAEALRKTLGVKPGYLDLSVLDSTDPAAVYSYAKLIVPERTLLIVSSKSGETIETIAFQSYFYDQMVGVLGREHAGEHFIAITAPNSRLAKAAELHHFRALLLNDTELGRRPSTLSISELLPAALIGVDLRHLLERAQRMMAACGANGRDQSVTLNPAVRLGAALGELARSGCDKATLITSPSICTFADWVEHLIAETTGKDVKGVLPVVGETVGEPVVYGKDRFIIYLRLPFDAALDSRIQALEAAGNPVMRLEMQDLYDLGAQFFLWEMAVAIAAWRLGIYPFDQPNIEPADAAASRTLAINLQSAKLPATNPVFQEHEIQVFADYPVQSLPSAWKTFLEPARAGAYIAIQAFIPPSFEMDASLLALRTRLRDSTGLAVTTGYGPRFLHSTGRLHKQDAGRGLFVQITADSPVDLPIPDAAGLLSAPITFGELEAAQAHVDRQALLDAGRRVIRFHVCCDALVGIARLVEAVG